MSGSSAAYFEDRLRSFYDVNRMNAFRVTWPG